jgi:hypothetical protein
MPMYLETIGQDAEVSSTEMQSHSNRNRIISLLRGQAACQAIAALAEAGVAEAMLGDSFAVEDFPALRNAKVLRSLFKYLQSLDLLTPPSSEGRYSLTSAGRTVFKRSGGFLLLSSYDPYFANLGNLLTGEEIAQPTVDRRRNVLGSGSLHSRKFFPCVWEMLDGNPPAVLIDLGCGDGTFLELACGQWPNMTPVASDMSPLAVNYSVDRLKILGRPAGAGIVEDACAVESVCSQLPATLKSASPVVVSIWFVAHEFSGGKPEVVIDFFRRLKLSLPNAEVAIAEIVAIPPDLLARNHEASIMPEFLFFHELSNQGVLSWEAWQEILKEIPYRLSAERQFDLVEGENGSTIPSSFLWHLKPA